MKYDVLVKVHWDYLKMNNVGTMCILMNSLYSVYMQVNFFLFVLNQ